MTDHHRPGSAAAALAHFCLALFRSMHMSAVALLMSVMHV